MTATADAGAMAVAEVEKRDPVIDIEGLTVSYRVRGREPVHAVREISLSVGRGEFVTIVGESGSGKSTTVQAVLGILPPSAHVSSGRIIIDGDDTTRWKDKAFRSIRGSVVGFVPQDPAVSLNPVKRIRQQILEALEYHDRFDEDGWDDRIDELLGSVGLPATSRILDSYPHELSGGMRQRILLAIALANEPDVIIADEPTSALDVTVQKKILDLMDRARQELGLTVLLITHDIGVALDRSDRIHVLENGRIVDVIEGRDAPLGEVSDYTRRLLAASPHLDRARITSSRPATGSVGGTAPLELVDVSKRFERRRRSRGDNAFLAVDGVSLTLRRGTTHAVVGESGAGKSTLARLAIGAEHPSSGSVRLDGRDLNALSAAERREMRRNLQFVYQNPYSSLDPSQTVQQLIADPLLVFGTVRSTRAAAGVVGDLLDAVALPRRVAAVRPEALSGGQRQRVAIARALALRPDVLVLDEPVSALDVVVQEQILELLVDLQAEFGVSYLFITHDLGVVRLVSDDVTVLRRGRVVESGNVGSVLSDPAEEYTRQLIESVPGKRLRARSFTA